MKICSLAILLASTTAAWTQAQYFPDLHWEEKEPEAFGIDSIAMGRAIQFAIENENSAPHDLRQYILKAFDFEPFHEIKGPTKRRGGPAGLMLKGGYIIAKWGDIERVDMTFSVTKSFLSTVAGLAIDDGLIESVNDPVRQYVWEGYFDSDHNSKITWHHLLTQSSDWSGELFGMEDWSDRPPIEGGIDDWRSRELFEPGTQYKYNDVRINLLSYSLLNIWRKPLPQVIKERVMNPIGASSTWRWYGYEDSWVTLDGLKMQSVSGGGHSGGGLFISTEDLARFGLLFLRMGKWNDQQLISERWIESVQQPSETNASYGYLWWLNKGPEKWDSPAASSIYYAAGAGGNFVVVDQENDLVVVVRWLDSDKIGEFMGLVSDAIQ